MRWFKEETDLMLIIGVLLIILGLGLTVFKEDKAEDILQKAVIKLPNFKSREIAQACIDEFGDEILEVFC